MRLRRPKRWERELRGLLDWGCCLVEVEPTGWWLASHASVKRRSSGLWCFGAVASRFSPWPWRKIRSNTRFTFFPTVDNIYSALYSTFEKHGEGKGLDGDELR